jgi:hypothetical protein
MRITAKQKRAMNFLFSSEAQRAKNIAPIIIIVVATLPIRWDDMTGTSLLFKANVFAP